MSGCPHLKRASCCASKWMCHAQVPPRRVSTIYMCRDEPEECAVYRRVKK